MAVDIPLHFADRILAHYDAHARVLPWRSPPGAAPPGPYRVWLSEVMLQQTTVAAVIAYFERFVARWPDVARLAAADDAEVMSAWAGLGYYARARNMLACARAVVRDHGGRFPDSEAVLRTLPGIGAYTAAAIAAIAFDRRAVVVDGNVERVISRYFAVSDPLPGSRPALRGLADGLTPAKRPGDFAQAMMDLGATVCTPRNPRCALCPVAADCAGKSDAPAFPVRAPRPTRPRRYGTAWWIERGGEVLLVRRPARGLLGGMRALPSSEWRVGAPAVEASAFGEIEHVFTHFALTLSVAFVPPESSCASQLDGEWWPIDRLGEAGLPSAFAKAAALAMKRRSDVRHAA